MHDRRRFLRGCGSVAVESGLGGGETPRNVQRSDESTRRLVDRMVTDRRRLHLEKRLGPFVAAYHAIVKKYPNLAAGFDSECLGVREELKQHPPTTRWSVSRNCYSR
jgi:hypothetical protein